MVAGEGCRLMTRCFLFVLFFFKRCSYLQLLVADEKDPEETNGTGKSGDRKSSSE